MKKTYFFLILIFLSSPNIKSSDLVISEFSLEGINCINLYPSLKNISILKNQLELEKKFQNIFPPVNPQYEIIWHDNNLIKAIIEIDSEGVWNGSIHSWYKSGEYLGCAGLKNSGHEGISIAYHKNGKVRALANFKESLPIGLEYQFNENGNLRGTLNHDSISSNEIRKHDDIH